MANQKALNQIGSFSEGVEPMHSCNQQYLLTMRLFGLFIKCPFLEATKDCPFDDIRSLQSLDLKFQLAEKMAMHPQCSENVCNTHEVCYRTRMQQVVKACRGTSTASTTQRTSPPSYDQAIMGRR